MRLLREIIRRIILESAEEYDTIIDGILYSDDPEYITSFIELAESLGYIEDYQSKYTPPKPARGWKSGAAVWQWSFDCGAEFGKLLSNKYDKNRTPGFKHPDTNVVVDAIPLGANQDVYSVSLSFAGPEPYSRH